MVCLCYVYTVDVHLYMYTHMHTEQNSDLFITHMQSAANAIPSNARVREQFIRYGIWRLLYKYDTACEGIQPVLTHVIQHQDIYTPDIWLPVLNIRGIVIVCV